MLGTRLDLGLLASVDDSPLFESQIPTFHSRSSAVCKVDAAKPKRFVPPFCPSSLTFMLSESRQKAGSQRSSSQVLNEIIRQGTNDPIGHTQL